LSARPGSEQAAQLGAAHLPEVDEAGVPAMAVEPDVGYIEVTTTTRRQVSKLLERHAPGLRGR
jgi:hypothetical protein